MCYCRQELVHTSCEQWMCKTNLFFVRCVLFGWLNLAFSTFHLRLTVIPGTVYSDIKIASLQLHIYHRNVFLATCLCYVVDVYFDR